MCRMIAAVGDFEMEPLVDGLLLMASNSNPAYEHEFSSEGDGFVHDCGWGVVFRDGDGFARRRSAGYCVDDPVFRQLCTVCSDLVVLHARRALNRDTISELNSHPFVHQSKGRTWAFCHNGTVNDVSQLDPYASPENGDPSDSERLFHHVLARLDPMRPSDSLVELLGGIHDFTSLNCFLADTSDVYAYARVSPDSTRRRYYTLWRGAGEGFMLVSSEPLSIEGVEWSPVPDGTAFALLS
jgi:predicted glutamine amidotransferase